MWIDTRFRAAQEPNTKVRIPAPISWRSGIEKDGIAPLFDTWYMTVSVDDIVRVNGKCRKCRFSCRPALMSMDETNSPSTDREPELERERFLQLRIVVVAPYSEDPGQRLEPVKHRSVVDIACVEYQINTSALEKVEHFVR